MTTEPTIEIPTSLLEAVARWALPEDEDRPHLSQVVFRNNEVIAVDGHRLVRVPIDTFGLTLGIRRCDALAAAAAQDAILGRRTRNRKLGIRRGDSPGTVGILLNGPGGPVLLVRETDVSALPPIEQVMPAERRTPPDGVAFNPRYLAAIHEVVSVLEERPTQRYLKLTSHGHPLDPALFEGPCGSRFVVMPMRQP